MAKKSEPIVLTKVVVVQDDRFAKENTGSRVITDLMASGLVEEIVEGRDRADVLMITPTRHNAKDAILATIRNTLAQLGV